MSKEYIRRLDIILVTEVGILDLGERILPAPIPFDGSRLTVRIQGYTKTVMVNSPIYANGTTPVIKNFTVDLSDVNSIRRFIDENPIVKKKFEAWKRLVGRDK